MDKSTLVIGSGISGLTAALLLAQKGRKVVLVEKLPFIGGFLNRFTRNNLRFDTGLHFTGGFGNVLTQLLQKLNLQDDVRPAPIVTSIHLAETGRSFTFPNTGIKDLADAVAQQFPKDADAIRKFYDAEQEVIDHTPVFNLDSYNGADLFSQLTPYDACTVDEFLDSLNIRTPELRTVLPIMSVCHGTPPKEAPFPYHCRCSYSLDSNLTAVDGGGDAFIRGFKRELAAHGAEIRTSAVLSKLLFSTDGNRCISAQLSTGESFDVEQIFFAVHPAEFLQLFPENSLPSRIRRRVARLQPTCSFFTIYGYLENARENNQLTFFLQNNDLNRILSPGQCSTSTGMVTSNARENDRTTFTAFRTMFLQDAQELSGVSFSNYRASAAYSEFKKRMTEQVISDVIAAHPDYRGKLHVIDAGSPFTCARFSPPTGAAYGTRQLLAVSRLAGPLPVQNCFTIGHHSYFPGILGGMLGAYVFTNPISPIG